MVEYTLNDDFNYLSNQDNGRFVTAIFTPVNISDFSYFGQNTNEEDDIDSSPVQQQNLNFAIDALAQESLLNPQHNQYWHEDETYDVGDQVQDYDLQIWNPKSSIDNYLEDQTTSAPKFNVDLTVQYLLKNALPKSSHRCAAYVRRGLQAGGINLDDRPRTAGQYLQYFRRKPQWTEINPSEVQKGDVCVTVNSADGHIAVWTGKNWISDFVQRGPHVYTYAVDGKNTFYFRYIG